MIRTVHNVVSNLHNDELHHPVSCLPVRSKRYWPLLVDLRCNWRAKSNPVFAFSDVKRCIATGEMAFDLPFFTCNIWVSVGISSHLAYQTTVDLGCIAGIHDLQAI